MLRYITSGEYLDDQSVEDTRIRISNRKTYTEEMIFKYKLRIGFGCLIGVSGLAGLILEYSFMFIMIPIGMILSILAFRKNKHWIKGAKGENMVYEYLNHLPNEFIVLNDLKLPNTYGNIDHVVLGPNGVFTIETKNLTGSYIVEHDNWYFNAGSKLVETYSNPGEQIRSCSSILNKFLSSKGLKSFKSSTFPIVAFINPNLTIKSKLKYYHVMHPSNLPKYIMGHKKKLSKTDVSLITELLMDYCAELSYSEALYIIY